MGPSALARITRHVAGTPLGRRAAEAAYRIAASGAARVLLRVPGVVSVYLGGSLTRGGSVWPGYSDIDVVPIVHVPDLKDELRLLEGLESSMHLLNRAGRLFKNVDYLDVADLDLYRTAGDQWSLDWDKRWLHLAGEDVRPGAGTPAADPEHWRIEGLTRGIRRWTKASSFILDRTAGRPPEIVRIGAERLLADGLAALLLEDRHVPLPMLLDGAARRAGSAGPLGELATWANAPRGNPPDTTLLVAGCLQALEQAARAATTTWHRQALAPRPELDASPPALVTRLLDAGHPTVVFGERSASDHVVVLVEGPDRSPREVLETLQRTLRTTERLDRSVAPWATRPVVVTHELLSAAFLFEPRLDEAARLRIFGQPLPPMPVVPRAIWDRHHRASGLASACRARCRLLRAHRTREAALAAMARDIERLDDAAGVVRKVPLPHDAEPLLDAAREHVKRLRHAAPSP